MAMNSSSYLLSSQPKSTLLPSITKPHQNLHSFPSHHSSNNTKNLLKKSLFAVGRVQLHPPNASAASIPFQPTNDEAYLQAEFGSRGVTFDAIGVTDGQQSSVVKMELDNGTMATVMLPSGLITSFKVPMWHGETLEMLHTQVSQRTDGAVVIRGGISLDLSLQSDDRIWSPSQWRLIDVLGSSDTSIQVDLAGCDAKSAAEVRYILKLQEDTLSSELIVSNIGSSKLQFMGSFITHLTVSTPDGTYAVGLEGSDFEDRAPLMSSFSFFPPDIKQKYKKLEYHETWDLVWDKKNTQKANNKGAKEEERIGEENESYKHLTDEMCRIYTYAPSAFTIIDRGRRNSLIVGREGFNELYLFSPGSKHEFYGKYAYVCVGQSAMLKPVILDCQETWRGVQSLLNPSLE